MLDHMGWWMFDAETQTLINRVSDQRLRFALACWPSSEAAGPEPSRIDTWGGWSNGIWSPRLRRVGAGRADKNTTVEDGLRPFLEPLASPPLSWHFVDAEEAVADDGLTGARTVPRAQHFLQGDAPLPGLETAIGHPRRKGRPHPSCRSRSPRWS